MSKSEEKALEMTYPLRTAARLTGLSPELLRAWERRHGVVEPIRTPGGTRRYTAADVARLRLLKSAVDAGHRIGEIARLDEDALRERAAGDGSPAEDTRFDELLAVLDRLDAAEARRQFSLQLLALGPVRFARDFALPLMRQIGERWEAGRAGIAAEHLATGVLRSLLGAALQPTAISLLGPPILFATPPGERHELGLQMAALTALGAGANPIYLGSELPAEDLLEAARASHCAVVALGIVTLQVGDAERYVAVMQRGLPAETRLWVGGAGAAGLAAAEGVETIATLEQLEQRVALLGLEGR